MVLEHLVFFATVAERGSINKAAQILHISQPHLSCIIRDLEHSVGLKLLERTKQGVALTPEGENFLKHSKSIILEMSKLKGLSRKTDSDADNLSVSMTRYSHTMDSFIEICRKKQNLENFIYNLDEGNTIEVLEDVVSGIASVGVINYTSRMKDEIIALCAEKKLHVQPIANLVPHIVISSSHELVLQDIPITLANLRPYGFVRYIDQYEDIFYNIANENLQTDLNESPKLVNVHDRASQLHLISVSNFYTIGIGAFSTQKSMYNIISVPVNCAESLIFAIVTQKQASLTPSALEFINDLTSRYQKIEAAHKSSN
jgi:DNA-binding transcriptional LysR family regulator